MTILYALVSRQQTVLAENTNATATGNFPTVTRVLLEKIPQQDGKMTYVYDEYVFHYIVENGICYLCMSDEKNKHRIPFAFLGEVKERFLAKFGLEAAQSAIAFSMNEDFKGTLADRMNFYDSDEADRSIDNIGTVKSQIDEVRDVMVQNIERVLERGEKIELLVDKTDQLNQQAFRFESNSRSLRRHLYWRQMRWRATIAVIVLVTLYFASVSVCGFGFQHCKASPKD
jgi:vesicle-associated membrane protein 7